MTIDVLDKPTEKPPLAGPIRRNRSALTYTGPVAVLFEADGTVGALDETVDLVCTKTIAPPSSNRAAKIPTTARAERAPAA